MFWDIILILQIEFSREAVAKALKVSSNSLLLNFHVTVALTTVILYFVMLWSGRRLWKGDNLIRQKHRILGMTTLSLRTIVYITSYFIVEV